METGTEWDTVDGNGNRTGVGGTVTDRHVRQQDRQHQTDMLNRDGQY